MKQINVTLASLTIAIACGMTWCASAQVVAYWPFGAYGLTDKSGNGNTLATNGTGVSFSEGKVTLNGSQSFNTAGTLNLINYAALTVEFWVRVPSVPGSVQLIMEQTVNYGTLNGAFYIDVNESGVGDVMSAYKASGGVNLDTTAAGALNDLKWHHVAMILDRSQNNANRSTLYFDGVMQGTYLAYTSGGTETFRNDTLYIGSRANSQYKFIGDLDDIRITAAALTPAQFLQSRTGQDPDVVAYWPFGANGTADVSGKGNHLVASGVAFTNGMARLDGTQSFFQSRLPLDLRACQDVTLEFWMRMTNTWSTSQLLMEHTEDSVASSASAGTGAFYIDANELGAGTVVSNFRGSDGYNQDMATNAPVNDGAWHHIALVYNRDTAGADRSLLYVDGTSQVTRASFNRDTWTSLRNAYLYLGSRANSQFKYAGDLDDVRISAGALLPPQFLQSRTADDAAVIAYWPFAEGSELADASGQNHTLTGTGVSFTNGIAVMSGAASLATAANLDLSAHSNLTVECFVRKDAPSANPALLFWHAPADQADVPGAFVVAEQGGLLQGAVRMDTGTNLEYSTDATLVTNGAWHHIALVYDAASNASNRVRLYIDRARQTHSPAATTDVLTAFTNALFAIGGNGFVGAMDDVRISGAALPPAQFLASHTDEAPLVLAYWPFAIGNELADSSTNAFSLAMVNTDDVVFENGAAKFTGYSGLSTQSQLDLHTFKALTVECMIRYTQTNPTANLIELSPNYNMLNGSFVLATGMVTPFKFGAGYRTSEGYSIDETTSGSRLADGLWHHLAYVIDQTAPSADMTRLYVDGVLQTQNSLFNNTDATPFPINQKLFLGWRQACNSPDWTTYANYVGEMDDVRVTAGALSPDAFMTVAARTAKPLSDDILAYWTFEPGNELADASGHGNTLSGNAAFNNGTAVFNGTNELQTVATLNLTTNKALTVEYFIRTRTAAEAIVIEQSANYNIDAGAFVFYTSADNMLYGGLVGNLERSEAGVLYDGLWHHVALVMDLSQSGDAQVEMYVDSQPCPAVSQATSAAFFNGTVYIGMRGGTTLGLTGEIDDVRITARALNKNEFLTRPTTALAPVIAYYPFNNRNPLDDASGNGYSLTNSGVGFNQSDADAVFTGSQSAFSTLDNLQLSVYTGFTIECFAKFASTNSMMLFESSAYTESTPGAFYMYSSHYSDGFTELQTLYTTGYFMNGSWIWVPMYNYDGTRTLQTATGNGQWHHLALVVNPANASADRSILYVDGQPQSNVGYYTADRDVPFANVPLYIGSRANSSFKFIGEIDDVRITGAALAPSQFLTKRSTRSGTWLSIQ